MFWRLISGLTSGLLFRTSFGTELAVDPEAGEADVDAKLEADLQSDFGGGLHWGPGCSCVLSLRRANDKYIIVGKSTCSLPTPGSISAENFLRIRLHLANMQNAIRLPGPSKNSRAALS